MPCAVWTRRSRTLLVPAVIAKWEALHRTSAATAWVVLSHARAECVAAWLDFFGREVDPGGREETLRSWLAHGGPALLIVDSERTVKFLAGLPGSTWRSVDDVCRSWTRTGKIVAGIRLMLRGTLPIVVVELKYRVRRTLKVLGSHPKGSVRAILNEVLHHPLRGVWLTEKNQAGHLALPGPAPGRAAGPDSARGTGRGIGGAQFLKLSPRRDVLESLQ